MKLTLPRLGLGAANLGNLYRAMSDDDAIEIVDVGWECGIRHFDTAPHYGLGLSERRLGAALRERARGDFVLSTKAGRLLVPSASAANDLANGFDVSTPLRRVFDFSEDGIRRSVDESLTRLGLDRIDVLYLHDPEEDELESALSSGLPALERLRDEGVVSAVGVGSKSVEALTMAVERGSIDVIMLAGRYTLLEQPALAALLPACETRAVRVVDVAVFNSGLLANPEPRAETHYEYGAVPKELLERARQLAEVCRSFGTDLPTAAIQYPLRHPAVDSVVMGASSVKQVTQNVARMDDTIDPALWEQLESQGLIPG